MKLDTKHPFVSFLADLAGRQRQLERRLVSLETRLRRLGHRDIASLHNAPMDLMAHIPGLFQPDKFASSYPGITTEDPTRRKIAQMLAPLLGSSSTADHPSKYKLIGEKVKEFNAAQGGGTGDFYDYTCSANSVDIEDISFAAKDLPNLLELFVQDLKLSGEIFDKGQLKQEAKRFLQNIYTLITTVYLEAGELDQLEPRVVTESMTALESYFASDDISQIGEPLKTQLAQEGFDKYKAVLLAATLDSACKLSQSSSIDLKSACQKRFTQLNTLYDNLTLYGDVSPELKQQVQERIKTSRANDSIHDYGAKDPKKQLLAWVREFNHNHDTPQDIVHETNLLNYVSGSKIALGLLRDAQEAGLVRDLVQAMVNTAENEVRELSMAGQDGDFYKDLSDLRSFDTKFPAVVQDLYALLTYKHMPRERAAQTLGLVQSLNAIDRQRRADLMIVAMRDFINNPKDANIQRSIREQLPEILAVMIYDCLKFQADAVIGIDKTTYNEVLLKFFKTYREHAVNQKIPAEIAPVNN